MYFCVDGVVFERIVCPQRYLVPDGFEWDGDERRVLRYEAERA